MHITSERNQFTKATYHISTTMQYSAKRLLCDNVILDSCCHVFVEPVKHASPKLKLYHNVSYSLWVITLCQRRFISRHKSVHYALGYGGG